jgi:hypothetical protein
MDEIVDWIVDRLKTIRPQLLDGWCAGSAQSHRMDRFSARHSEHDQK